MSLDPITAVLDIGGKLIDRLWPNPTEKEKAKLELIKLQQSGQLKELEVRMSAIVMEAKSTDPWTSRARPSFLYVIYFIILMAVPMSIIFAFEPNIANRIILGFSKWLHAIPEPLWALFGAGYLGYSASRSYDKRQLINQK